MSVQVAVRSRPVNKDELETGSTIIVRMNGAQVEVMESAMGAGARFAYDHAFWSTNAAVQGNKNPLASQETLFGSLGQPLVHEVVAGFNACLFAYGQTGSGKSYTLLGGGPGEEGIVPRTAQVIFSEVARLQAAGVEVCVQLAACEIYNERVRDLLNPNAASAEADYAASKLRVREHPVTGPYVEGLARFAVTSRDEFLRLVADSAKVRSTGATAMNAASSRSHAIFTITLTQKKQSGALVTTRTSRLNLVDLAGSERADKTHARGARLAEGANINKSLLVLGNVIHALSDAAAAGGAGAAGVHIPYRDSVLTWVLKDNLGGNSKTVMLATISPASAQYEETMSTLRYAERAKKIVNKAVVNESNNSEVIAALQREIEALRTQLASATSAEARQQLDDEIDLNETVVREMAMSTGDHIAATAALMQERDARMAQLEEALSRQRDEITALRRHNDEKDRRINDLLRRITDTQHAAGAAAEGGGADDGGAAAGDRYAEEIERLRQQIAELEVARNEEMRSARGRGDSTARPPAAASRDADDTAPALRAEDMGNVAQKLAAAGTAPGGRVTVRALARAYEAMGQSPVVVRKVSRRRVAAAAAEGGAGAAAASADGAAAAAGGDDDEVYIEEEVDIEFDEAAAEEPELDLADENVLDALDDDVQIDEPEVQLDDEDDAVDVDDEDGAVDIDGGGDEAAKDGDVQIDDDEAVAIDDDENIVAIDDEAEAGAGTAPAAPVAASTGAPATAAAATAGPAGGGEASAAPAVEEKPIEVKPADIGVQPAARDRSQTVTQARGQEAPPGERPGIIPPAQAVSTVVIPSHTLPNNRFLREPFKVIKIDESAIIGGKKERIWDVDFFAHKFANLDMTGYESFSQPAANLFRVEKNPVHSRKLILYFFEAPHPYELEFTSTERRQRFYELAMLQRRNSIMWCPSLCVEGENDAVLHIQATTIERPNGKVVKAKGEVKFMVARMPYEVIDFWYGCVSLQGKGLPRSANTLASFIPKGQHEVYIIGVSDVPPGLIGGEELGNYFLGYLGPQMFFVLANTAVESRAGPVNNAIVVIVRRSFIVRMSHVEATELQPVRRDAAATGRAEFTAVGASLRINEASIAVILLNTTAAITDPAVRASCIRGLLSNFPFGDTSLDIGVRFDYLIVSGNFGFKGDFTANDMLVKQMRAGNVISDFFEAEAHPSLAAEQNPLRIFVSVRPRTCRFDIKQYQTSRAMGVPNAFIAADVFCQRAFLSTFGEPVPRVQFILNKLRVVGNRIPHINGAELQMSGEWIDASPLLAPLDKRGDTYEVSGRNIPAITPVVSNFDFLRLQSINFSVFGILPAAKDKRKLVIASGTLPLKNSFSLGDAVDFGVPLFYRGCRVGTLEGSLLQVHTEKNDAEIAQLGVTPGERDAVVVTCFENQVLQPGLGTWAASMYPDNGAWDWSSRDVAVQARRESFVLPDPAKWKWLTQWRHEARIENVDGWVYAASFTGPFELRKSKAHVVRRRRWSRVMQADDALTLHQYLEAQKKATASGGPSTPEPQGASAATA